MQHADDNTGFNPIEFDGIKSLTAQVYRTKQHEAIVTLTKSKNFNMKAFLC